MYELQFDESDLGRQRYEMCFQSVALTQKQVPVADWDDVVDLVRKLKSIGNPAKEKIGSYTLYDLQEGGGTITLEKGEMKQLIDFVGQPIWRPLALADAQELKKWLEKIPKIPGSRKPDARPEERRRAEARIAGSIEQAETSGGNETPSTVGNAS